MYSTASCLPRCSQCRGSDEFHHASAYDNLAHARAAIGEFIETIYNRQRLHSALDYLFLLMPIESPTFTLKNWQLVSGQQYAVE